MSGERVHDHLGLLQRTTIDAAAWTILVVAAVMLATASLVALVVLASVLGGTQ